MPDLQEPKNAQDLTEGQGSKVLAVGGIGVGKTTAFLTMPGKKFMYIFEKQAEEVIEGEDVDFLTFCPDITDLDLSIKTLKKGVGDKTKRKVEPRTYVEWEEDFEARLASGFFDAYDWLGFDSFTTFSEIVMDRLQYHNGRLGKQPEQADWAAQMTTLQNVFRAATGQNRNLFCTAHTELRKDEALGKFYGHIMMTGRLRIRLPLLFNHIFACRVETDKESAAYQVQTIPDRINPVVRTTIRGLQMFEDVTVDWNKDVAGQGLGRILSKKRP